MEALAMEFHRSRRYQHPFALLFLDVDCFKEINDLHEHVFGDHVLLHVARADGAMYCAKRKGRNRVELYSEACASKNQSG